MKQLSGVGVLGIITLIAPVIGSLLLFWAFGATEIGPWLKSHGVLAVAIFSLVFMVLTGSALMPTYAMSAVAGFAFGVPLGGAAALAGLVGGALVGYLIAQRASGDRVQRVIDANPRWSAVRDALLGHAAMDPTKRWLKTSGFIALLRCPPNCPFSFTNLVLASVRTPISAFLIGTFVGMAPRTLIAVVIGAGVKELTNEQIKMPKVWIIAGVVLAVVVVMIIGTVANKALAKLEAQKPSDPKPSDQKPDAQKSEASE
jgi:uncharacterized membrane protein YdjX (TVP38/TMEM64 family)